MYFKEVFARVIQPQGKRFRCSTLKVPPFWRWSYWCCPRQIHNLWVDHSAWERLYGTACLRIPISCKLGRNLSRAGFFHLGTEVTREKRVDSLPLFRRKRFHSNRTNNNYGMVHGVYEQKFTKTSFEFCVRINITAAYFYILRVYGSIIFVFSRSKVKRV